MANASQYRGERCLLGIMPSAPWRRINDGIGERSWINHGTRPRAWIDDRMWPRPARMIASVAAPRLRRGIDDRTHLRPLLILIITALREGCRICNYASGVRKSARSLGQRGLQTSQSFFENFEFVV